MKLQDCINRDGFFDFNLFSKALAMALIEEYDQDNEDSLFDGIHLPLLFVVTVPLQEESTRRRKYQSSIKYGTEEYEIADIAYEKALRTWGAANKYYREHMYEALESIKTIVPGINVEDYIPSI